MANYHQPTKEELKRNMTASLEKLKTLPPEDPKKPKEPETPPADPPQDPPTPSQDPPQDPPTPPKEPETPPATPPKEETPAEKIARLEKEVEDTKKKFSNSSREAQVLGFKEKELAKAQEQADQLPEPTDEEMKAIYPNWDEIDKLTQDLAKDRVLNKKKNEIIQGARAKFKDVQDWTEKVDTYIGNPQTLIDHPELEGKTEDFKAFASKPSRKGVEFDDLVLAFMGDLAKNKPAPKKGGMFPTGGSRTPEPPKPKDDTLSPAEGEQLRLTDYKKYVQMLKAHKIRNE